MLARTLIQIVGHKYDQLVSYEASAEHKNPVLLEEELTSLANLTEKVFFKSAIRQDIESLFDEARRAAEEVDQFRQLGTLSPDAAEFLSQRVFEPLIFRFGRSISG